MSYENAGKESEECAFKEFAVIRRTDGRYKSNVTLDHGRRRTVYGKTEEEVRHKAREAQENSYLGKEEHEIKFRDYFTQWLITTKKKSLKPTSYDRLERTFQCYLEPEIGGTQIGKLTTFRLQALINKYSDRLSYSSVKGKVLFTNSATFLACIIQIIRIDRRQQKAQGMGYPRADLL